MKYPITIKRAKEIARARLGRLPGPGFSVTAGGVFQGNPPVRKWDYQLDLYNHAGIFFLQSWERPFSNPDMSTFQTIEHDRDYRHE